MVARIKDTKELIREKVSEPESIYARILFDLRKGKPKTLGDIAADLNVTLSTVSTPVLEMAHLAWLQTDRQGRKKTVMLTTEGAAVRKQIRTPADQKGETTSRMLQKGSRRSRTMVVTPGEPLGNTIKQVKALASVGDSVLWWDRYMDESVFEVIISVLKKRKGIRRFRILTTPSRVDGSFRNLAARAKTQFANQGVEFEARILRDENMYRDIHDRFILGQNQCYVAAPHQSIENCSLAVFAAIDDEIDKLRTYLESAWQAAETL